MVTINTKTARLRLRKTRDGDRPVFVPVAGGVSLGWRPSSGKWIARWFVDGREIQRSLKAWSDDDRAPNGINVLNFAQASKRALEISNQSGDVSLEAMTVGTCFERYRKSRDAIGRDTTDSLQRYRKWIEPTFKSVRVSKLRKAELVAWRDDVAREVKPATVNRTLAIFKACLRFGIEELEIPTQGMPIWRALKVLPVENKARDRFLTPDELTRLVNACDAELRPLILAASFTGARFGDIARLTVADWDPALEKIRIQNAKTNRPRFVRVSNQGAKFFESITAGRKPREVMLTRIDGDPWRKNTYRRSLIDANKNASIDPPANFHAIRHSYASAMKRAGVDDTIIASALGHASTRMVQEHYGHLDQSHVDDQIAKHAPRLGIKIPKSNVTRHKPRHSG